MTGSTRRPTRSRPKPSADAGDDDQDPISRPRRPKPRNQGLLRLTKSNLKILLGLVFIALLLVLLVALSRSAPAAKSDRLPSVVTPLPAPKMMDLPQFQGEHKESLYWGTYRPLVYLGIRARSPRSLIAGLMWIEMKDGQYFMRHLCQDSDDLSTYGWTHHNGRDYGQQVLADHSLTLTTSFLKIKTSGSGYGGDWAVRIAVQNGITELDEEAWKSAHLFFYLADENGNTISINERGQFVQDSTLLASGSREDVGDWKLHLSSSDNLEVHYAGFRSPHTHNLTELLQQTLAINARRTGHLLLPDISEQLPNIVVFQASGRLPFKMDVTFLSGTGFVDSREEERFGSLTGGALTGLLNKKQKEFEDKFVRVFNLTEKVDSESLIVGRAALSNMLGGIGYFYGQSKIALSVDSNVGNGKKYIPYWPAALYSAVPSRPFFPRGFLWDEGFHQLIIRRWDVGISLDILGHWLDLMNADGWIPREQILGAEALSKVPEEFVVQNPTNANPPTLFLVLHELVTALTRKDILDVEGENVYAFLERAVVRLDAWFNWFNTSQKGKDAGSFYWHGRDNMTTRELNPKTLSSGLDDYPRASHPSEDERHLDLRCWILLAADCIHSIGELLGKKVFTEKGYYTMAKHLSDFNTLNQMHLDFPLGAYFDFGNHTEKVHLKWKEVIDPSSGYVTRALLRDVSEKPHLCFVPHVGYVSLFPLMMKIIPPTSWVLEKQLDLLSNRSILWTDYGIRSLSKTSSLYLKRNTEHDPPYWRGPIWMNMNYLILSALHHYSQEDGPYKARAKSIYEELRSNIIGNVVRNYVQTGYFWEQYDATKKGKGKGARVFTGWTSLVLLMMAEAY